MANRAPNGAANEKLRPTISYDEALSREMEYRKRVNPSSSLATPSSQPRSELPREQSLSGTKRKFVSESVPPVPAPTIGTKILPKPFGDHQTRPHLQVQQSPMCQLQHQNPIARPVHNQRPLAQAQQLRPSLHPSFPPNQMPLQYNRQGQHLPYWCNICKMNCTTAYNLKQHRQGSKHKAKMEEVCRGKQLAANVNKMFWCKDCRISCTDEAGLAQHFAGKKHATTINALRYRRGAFGARAASGSS